MEDYKFHEGNLDFLYGKTYAIDGGAVLYCREGEGRLTIGRTTYDLKPSTVAMLLPETAVSIANVTKPLDAVLWTFSPKFFDRLNAGFSPTFFHMVVSSPTFQLETGSDNDEFVRMTLKLVSLLCAKKEPVNAFHEDLRIRNLAQNLVVSVADWAMPMMSGQDVTVDRKRQLYRQFIIDVCHNCKREHFIEFYCDRLCISRRYLSQIVKECNPKYTPQMIIIDHLNFKIKRALLTSDKTITQIADDFGFQNQSNLSAFFIRNNNISPTEFRNTQSR